MRKRGPQPYIKLCLPPMLAVFAAGLIVSYLLPTAWIIFLLAVGLLILALCCKRH